MVRRWFRSRRHAQVLRADAHAARLLIGPLAGKLHGYVPWTGHALRPFALATLLNDLVVNRRRSYLEFGAGVSTVFVAKVAELNGLEVDLASIEHDPAWIEVLESILAREGLAGRVRFVHSPLMDRSEPAPFGTLRWYDEQPVLDGLQGRRQDLVLVDGPPAGNGSMNRYPALPFLRANGLLADDATVLLDDVHRPAERAIARSWSAQYRMKFELLHGRVAYAVPPGRFAALVD
jgi:hypothetical protein